MTARRMPKRSTILAIVVLSLVGLAVSGVTFQRYAAVWMRSPPRMPGCVLHARRSLGHEELVSPSVAHKAPNGETVYLRKSEARAVLCMDTVSPQQGEHLAAALAETEPELRALELLKVLRDQVSRDPSADREALAVYLIASGAMRALPELPETKAAIEELQLLNACRFSMRTPCPTRPPIPLLVWIAGVPSALGLLFGIGVGVAALVMRVQARRRKPVADAPANDEPANDEPSA
ncbi:hypothetical protein [Polyangium aurulentum]|uniref:hypothetical protein n=1 Tax=Polyangium aurulentum TaxID=2567896 RepID=UPI0010AE4252|nr:hypothetical protein [Polyangium aurulentum]UQA60273.1 hypothetical protein E8A73_007290 [Polyangium aurulentum]